MLSYLILMVVSPFTDGSLHICLAALGAFCSAAANISGQIRGKDDVMNHAIAGALTGIAFGVYRKCKLLPVFTMSLFQY